jgi:hypothetical protein
MGATCGAETTYSSREPEQCTNSFLKLTKQVCIVQGARNSHHTALIVDALSIGGC